MKNSLSILVMSVLIFACGAAEDAASDGVNSTLESIVKSQTGQEIDLGDAENYRETKAKISFQIAGKEQFQNETITGVIMGQKDQNGKLVTLQYTTEGGTSVTVYMPHFPEKLSLPFTTNIYLQNQEPKDQPSASIIYMKLSEGGLEAYMGFSGELSIHEFNEDKVTLEVKGKIGPLAEMANEATWKEMNMELDIQKPIIQTIGMEKEEILAQ